MYDQHKTETTIISLAAIILAIVVGACIYALFTAPAPEDRCITVPMSGEEICRQYGYWHEIPD